MVGSALVALPLGTNGPALVGLVIAGLGCAPIYPSIIHSTPANFGSENSQAIIGIQMASAYVGSTFMPPLFGFIAHNFPAHPWYLESFSTDADYDRGAEQDVNSQLLGLRLSS